MARGPQRGGTKYSPAVPHSQLTFTGFVNKLETASQRPKRNKRSRKKSRAFWKVSGLGFCFPFRVCYLKSSHWLKCIVVDACGE